PLLGEKAHRHARTQKDERQVEEDRFTEESLDRALVDGELGVLREVVHHQIEVRALDDQEEHDDDPSHRRDEEREELALEDRPEAPHFAPSVSSANTCSSEGLTGDSSRRPKPAAIKAPATRSEAASMSSTSASHVTVN